MIRIRLKKEFANDVEINSIFERIATRIYDKTCSNYLSCLYGEETIIFDTHEKIKDFLLAKDFYNYKFSSSLGDFFCEIKKIKAATNVESVVGEKESNSEIVKQFLARYQGKQIFQDLKSVVEQLGLKKRCMSNDVKKKIIEKMQPNYIDISELINYENLTFLERHKIICKMRQPVCPYCNMNYTINYKFEDEERTTADLDHFYIKSQYPEYSLCLYNFVPSCPVCNSKLKGTKNMNREDYVFPHETSFENKAKIEILNIGRVMLEDEPIQVGINFLTKDEQVFNSSKLFKIKEIYEQKTDLAEELLEKAIVYNQSYVEELSELDSLKMSDYEIKKMIFGDEMSEEDIGNVSLGKMKRDILQQLNIYK